MKTLTTELKFKLINGKKVFDVKNTDIHIANQKEILLEHRLKELNEEFEALFQRNKGDNNV